MAELTIRINLAKPDVALRELSEAVRLVKKMARQQKPEGFKELRPSRKPGLGTRSEKLFASILTQIEQNGESTLEAVAELPEWACTPASLRGTMMNAMRTLRHSGGELPFHAEWNGDRACVVYSAKVQA
jgi:hypothetical protein